MLHRLLQKCILASSDHCSRYSRFKGRFTTATTYNVCIYNLINFGLSWSVQMCNTSLFLAFIIRQCLQMSVECFSWQVLKWIPFWAVQNKENLVDYRKSFASLYLRCFLTKNYPHLAPTALTGDAGSLQVKNCQTCTGHGRVVHRTSKS